MALRSLASKAVRLSRVLSTHTARYILIHSTPVTPKLTGPSYHHRLFTPRNSSLRLVNLHKSDTSLATLLLPALCLGLSLTPVLAEEASTEVTATDSIGLQKIDDGSVVSNIHTSKWRVFTDSGRDLFLQGKLEDAERLFVGALDEARQGFGERDPHVASACNNLAELYRVKKAYDKAEPLYLEAINILEESYGIEDIRVGAALHNLGQFYLVQKELDGARACYERALKIKRRVLGEGHADYAETMYHLGKVLHLQGKGKDAEALIKDSIRILEEGGQGESFLCMRRQQYLVQIYINSGNLTDAVDMQRKILLTMEESKGWESLETVIAAERLALILVSAGGEGSLVEAKLLLQRCLDSRRKLLRDDNIQIAANMFHMARVELLLCSQTQGNISEAAAFIDNAKQLLGNAIRIAGLALDKLIKQGANSKSKQFSKTDTYSERTTLLILVDVLNPAAFVADHAKESERDLRSTRLRERSRLVADILAQAIVAQEPPAESEDLEDDGTENMADYDIPLNEAGRPGGGLEPSIAPPIVVAPNFEIKSSIINMLQNSVQFDGKEHEDLGRHIGAFLELLTTFKMQNVSDDAIRFRVFPFSLRDKVKKWLLSLPAGSVTTWDEMAQLFMQTYSEKTTKLNNRIMTFRQNEDESLPNHVGVGTQTG